MPTPTAYLVLTALPHNMAPLGVLPAPLGQTFALSAGKNIIGRSAPPQLTTATILLPWVFVSRNHAQIEYIDGAGWEIIDLNSRNGTFVNGHAVQSHCASPLADGDRVGIGSVQTLEFQFFLHLPPSARPQQPIDADRADGCVHDRDRLDTAPDRLELGIGGRTMIDIRNGS